MIAYASWVVFVLAWNVFDRRARTVAEAGRRRERLHELVLAVGLVCIVLAPAMRAGGTLWVNPPAVDWMMLLVMAGGIGWCWWARLHLGRLWSAEVTRQEGHHVVDTGPYRLVRHPIYTGFIVMYAAMAMICATPLAFGGLLLMTVGLWLKARIEERFLAEELGRGAYGAYRARTPMLLPRLPGR